MEILSTPLRVFRPEALYRRRGDVRSGASALTLWWRGQAPGRASLACGALVAPLLLSFGSLEAFE
jgi:hypothetical protein